MRILVVEDDPALSDVIAFTLRRAAYEVFTAADGLAALDSFEQTEPDLILLDLNLPKLDGLSVCRQVRQISQVPIIILSVRAGDEAVVNGLELGADDYIVKPFSPTQLVARVRAVLRRAGVQAIPAALEAGGLVLDRARGELHSPGRDSVRLTSLELRLLEALMNNAGQVLPSETLISIIWGPEGGDRTMLKQLVYRLRAKVELDTSRPIFLETVPGIGYVFNPSPD